MTRDQEAGLFSFDSMEKTDFPYSDYEHLTPVSEDFCRKACLTDCFCTAVFYGNGNCFKRQSPVSSGVTDITVNGKSMVKIRRGNSTLEQLIGFCSKGQHRLLVVEFMSNGSLASFLFGPSRPHWDHGMQIALGIARGLFYLHE